MIRSIQTSLVVAALAGCLLLGCQQSKPPAAPAPSSTATKSTPSSSTPSTTTDTSTTDGGEAAEGWGDLKMQFVYDGPPVTPEKLVINKDVEVCSKHAPVDETLVLGEDVGGKKALVNVVVYTRDKDIAIHPDLADTPTEPVTIDNHNCRFDPHVSVLRAGQPLDIKNSDPVSHNTKGDCFANDSFNILIPAGQDSKISSLGNPERLPVTIGCNIHPWMSGYMVIREDPYAGVSGKDGTVVIEKLPAGEHEIQLWQEKSGYLEGVEINGKAARKGRFKITIKPGMNDLGVITVPASLFNK